MSLKLAVPAGLFLLALAVRLVGLGTTFADTDEFTAAGWALSPSWADLHAQLFRSHEGNPLGYALFLRLWGFAGVSLFWIRLPSALAGAVAAAGAFLWLKKRCGGEGALVAGLYLALLPSSVFLGQYARSFALSSLILLGALIAAAHAIEKERIGRGTVPWVFLLLSSVALHLHHLNALFLVPLLLSWFLVSFRKSCVRSCIPGGILFLALLPNLSLLSVQSRFGPRWIPGFHLGLLWELMEQGRWWVTLPFLCLFAAGLGRALWRKEWLLPAFTLLPPVLGVAISFAWRPIFQAKYFFPSVMGAALLGGYAVLWLPSRWRSWVFVLPLSLCLQLPEFYRAIRGADFAGAAQAVLQGRESCGPRAAVDPTLHVPWALFWNQKIEVRTWHETSQIQKPYWLVEAGRLGPPYLHSRILQDPQRWEGQAAWAACIRE